MADGTLPFDQGEELDVWITPTPLSDPVITAIFQNAEVSGLAMRSFLNATLGDSGDNPVREVVTVTPQSIHSETSSRGFRIDVEACCEDGEIALVEVQLKPFSATVERGLLYAEQALASGAKRGEKLARVISAMPKVIVVNILEKALRGVGGFHQVAEVSYREPPYQRATDKFAMHNIELDKYRRTCIDNPATPLQCWLTAICRSQDKKKPLMEVVKMEHELQAYYNSDPGFAQFVERHGAVASMPDVRKAYRRWEYDIILDRLDEERRAAEMEARLAESEAKGKADSQMEIALKAFAGLKRGRSLSDIVDTLKEFGIPDEAIEEAKKQTEPSMGSSTVKVDGVVR